MSAKLDEPAVYPIKLDIGKDDLAQGTQNVSHVATAYQQSSLTSPFAGASAYQTTSYPSAVSYQSSELYDPTKSLTLNSVARSLDPSTLQSVQARILDPKLSASVQDPKSLSSQAQQAGALSNALSAAAPNTSANGNTGNGPSAFTTTYDERYHIIYEREIRWTEVRKYSECIRKYAEASHMDITKEGYYDLYNMAVCLLKSVDGLDPDKLNRKANDASYSFLTSQLAGQVHPGAIVTATPINVQPTQTGTVTDIEMLQRKNFDFFVNSRANAFDGTTYLSAIPKYAIPTAGDAQTIFYNQAGSDVSGVPVGMNSYAVPLGATNATPFQGSASFIKQTDPLKPKNFTGEVFFDDLNQGDDRRPKRRRRRTVYSSRRNLHCHMCGVTETPEWRRGPQGDHTLCNACGLHYAKSLKKQRKERDARKHSIDMLLNSQSQPLANATGAGTPASPTSPNPSSSPSSGSTPTPPPPEST